MCLKGKTEEKNHALIGVMIYINPITLVTGFNWP